MAYGVPERLGWQKKEVMPGVVVKLNLCISWDEEYHLLTLAGC